LVPAPTSISQGPTKPSSVSYVRSTVLISFHVSARSLSLSAAIIWCSAPKDSRSKRAHSAADGNLTGESTLRTSTPRNPACSSALARTRSPPSENGPGCPGNGGGNCARRRMMPTGWEKNGFFSSADMGVAGLATLGKRWGEVYGTVTNGGGYTNYDNPGSTGQPVTSNRFKDFGLRVSLTPFGHDSTRSSYLRNLAITPWGYIGYNGSAFQSGGAGQVGPGTNGAITSGMTRNRFGILATIKDSSICDFRNGGRCRLSAGLEYAQRRDASDNGGNTTASPRVVHDSTGRVLDAFLFIRPVEVFDPSHHSPFSLVARFDHFTPQTDPASSVPGAANYAGSTPAYNFVVLGASYDVNQRITLTADWQNQSPTDFPVPTGTNVKPTPQSTIFFIHFVVNF